MLPERPKRLPPLRRRIEGLLVFFDFENSQLLAKHLCSTSGGLKHKYALPQSNSQTNLSLYPSMNRVAT